MNMMTHGEMMAAYKRIEEEEQERNRGPPDHFMLGEFTKVRYARELQRKNREDKERRRIIQEFQAAQEDRRALSIAAERAKRGLAELNELSHSIAPVVKYGFVTLPNLILTCFVTGSMALLLWNAYNLPVIMIGYYVEPSPVRRFFDQLLTP
jgi:hypothetical protein